MLNFPFLFHRPTTNRSDRRSIDRGPNELNCQLMINFDSYSIRIIWPRRQAWRGMKKKDERPEVNRLTLTTSRLNFSILFQALWCFNSDDHRAVGLGWGNRNLIQLRPFRAIFSSGRQVKNFTIRSSIWTFLPVSLDFLRQVLIIFVIAGTWKNFFFATRRQHNRLAQSSTFSVGY